MKTLLIASLLALTLLEPKKAEIKYDLPVTKLAPIYVEVQPIEYPWNNCL